MLKVLIVDDEPWVLEGLRTMVDWERFGFEVCGEALNGPDALRMAERLKPDLVLTDIHIPVFNGLELITRLNQSMVKPPRFVILSGYDDFQYARTALRQRVDQYLLKPIDDEEIEALLSRISLMIHNEIASNLERQKKQAMIVGNLINRLIQGEDDEDIQLMAANLMNIPTDAELLGILIDPPSAAALLQQHLKDYFPCELAGCFQDSADRFGLILQSAFLSRDSLTAGVNRLQQDLAEQLQEPVAVMVSERMSGALSLKDIYLQTLEMWKLKYRREKGGVFFNSDFRNSSKELSIDQETFTELLEKVKAGDIQAIEPCVRDIFMFYTQHLFSVEAVQAGIAHLEMTLCRLITERNGETAGMMNQHHEEFGNLGELGDYFRLGSYVSGLCRRAAVYLAELQEANEGNTIYNVIQYVDLEFRNKLQLQELARQFHMNSAYLGQVFRKETGRSFCEYLNHKRIEAAKGLLKRTELKISDVAAQVGFSNTDYFIDKFKRIVGVLPSVYKNSNNCKQR
ncbi:response regulator [Paenibacillus tianjinensis]|uniref:Response regulator n=1 Tax=Paenibacillus tianjinensis TaxID=2810347 RepID=A0ABX7L8C6_9BACL|nr:response regulator [Paenibacillus tianjinensis]QSF44424.1 response regulator [Paenibacillus tianjinensis]